MPQMSDAPQVPRPISRRVIRRAWNEPSVRYWWLAAAVIVIASVYSLLAGTMQWWGESKLLRDGVAVTAVYYDVSEGAHLSRRPMPVLTPVQLEYEYQQTKYKVSGTPTSPEVRAKLSGEPFTLRINPNNPQEWTDLQEPPSLWGKLIGFWVLLLAALVSGAMAWFKHRGYVRLWVNGEVRDAKVMEAGNVAIAPRSTQLRCSASLGRYERPVTVYIPNSDRAPEPGEPICLIANDSGTHALAVSNYYP